MRKLFSIIMALLATSALWAYDFQSGDLYYNITSDTTVEVTYQALLSDSNYLDITSITIPEFVEHGGITYSVTSISEYAFTFCSSLSHITIPQSVTKIGSSAFSSTGINKDESNWDNGGLYIDHCLVEVKSDFSGDFSLKEGTRLLAMEVFYHRSFLKSITIPNSLQNISDRAFVGCDSLSSIIIEDGVNSIGNSAFEGCVSLSSIVIPNSISNIGEKAFFNCSSLRSIVIPEGVTTIEREVFTNCSSLESVTLPNTLKSIKNQAFYSCESLDSIQIPNSLTNIGSSAFGFCRSLSSISIPNTIDSIKTGTFNYCTNLKSVELPESITSIGHIAFQNCYSLTSITIPKNVRSIGTDAFFQCLSLNSIVVEAINPPSLEETNNHFEIPNCYIPCGTTAAYEASDWAQYVGEFVEDCDGYQITYTSTDGNVVKPYNAEAFGANIVSNTYENGVGTITFDGPVTSIGDYAFDGCSSLTLITIPESVTSIGYRAFSNCSCLTLITIPESVTRIGSQVFWCCSSLTSMVVESSNTVYDSRGTCNAIIETASNTLIAGCRNTIIPNSVTSIGGWAFYYCFSLTSITIPNSVTSIGDKAFAYCNLTSITIPNSVTSIGWSAFENTGIYHNEANWENGVLYISNCLIAAKNDISGSYAIKEDTRLLAGEAFAYCHSLTSITIPESVTSIGDKAFRDCSSLKSVVWNAKKCEDFTSNFNPFNGSQSQISSFIIGDRVEHIPAYLCYNMASLTSVTIPSSVTSIGGRAFRRTAIYHDEANWESGVLYISNCLIEAKEDISGSYAIKDNTRMLANYAFYGCSSLTSIAIPNSITGIGDWAFGWCFSLTSIAIPNSVTSIGEGAFYGCCFLDTLYIEATTPPVLESNMFEYAPASICYISCGTLTAYQASAWAQYVGEFVEKCDNKCGNQLYWGYDSNELSIIGYGNMYDYDLEPQPWQQYRDKMQTISLPEGITSIGASAFAECKYVKSVTIPSTVEKIGFSAFENCRMLSNLTFAANGALTSIDNRAFYNNHELKNVVIPEGVTSIGYAAFYGCTYLSELTLPASMQAIEDNGFALCAKLRRMNVDALIPPTVAARTFEDVDRTIPVVVPDESVSVYKSAPVWQEFNIQGKSEVPAALDNIHAANSDTRKLLRDGQLVILRDGKEYNVMGQEL